MLALGLDTYTRRASPLPDRIRAAVRPLRAAQRSSRCPGRRLKCQPGRSFTRRGCPSVKPYLLCPRVGHLTSMCPKKAVSLDMSVFAARHFSAPYINATAGAKTGTPMAEVDNGRYCPREGSSIQFLRFRQTADDLPAAPALPRFAAQTRRRPSCSEPVGPLLRRFGQSAGGSASGTDPAHQAIFAPRSTARRSVHIAPVISSIDAPAGNLATAARIFAISLSCFGTIPHCGAKLEIAPH